MSGGRAEEDSAATREASTRPRSVRAVLSVLVALAAAVAILAPVPSTVGRDREVALVLVVIGLGLLVVGLAARLVGSVAVATFAFGAAYAVVHLHAGADVPISVVAIGPGLLAMAELAAWSIDLSPAAADEQGVFRERAVWEIAAVGGTAAASLLLAALSRVRLTAGIPLDAVGVVASIGALALVALLADRGRIRR